MSPLEYSASYIYFIVVCSGHLHSGTHVSTLSLRLLHMPPLEIVYTTSFCVLKIHVLQQCVHP
jgi:hypothetical protein